MRPRSGYAYLEHFIAQRVKAADKPHKHKGWIAIPAMVVLTFLGFAPMMCASSGCATNYTRYDESHYYPTGLPKSIVHYKAAQLTTAGSKLAEGANTFTRLDDSTFESGNTSSGLEAAGDPVEALRVALPVLELLAAPPAAVAAQEGSPLVRLIEILRATKGAK